MHKLSKSLVLSLLLLLSACGGQTGFFPVITAVKPEVLRYGNTATIYLGGKHLRSYLSVDTAGGCTSPSFSAASTPELLVLNCSVKTVGDMPLTIKDPDGKTLYTTTLQVPQPQVALNTSLGRITLELDPAKAPITVQNFLNYVRQGYYQNTLFHRVIPGFVVQGGGYTAGLVKKPGQTPAIELESNKGLSNLRGTLAMARTNVPNSATSEFFINLVDNTTLDYRNSSNPGYAVFGRVTDGLAIADTMASQSTGTVNGFADVPTQDIVITSAVQTR
jgi:cyclophilin family peptidyl-prolyl cis-trans isomerase